MHSVWWGCAPPQWMFVPLGLLNMYDEVMIEENADVGGDDVLT